MSNQKDELITASELARRLKVNPSYIANKKSKLKDAKCMYGTKFYYIKSCLLLGKDPNNPHESRQSQTQKDKNWHVTRGKKKVEEKVNEILNELNQKKTTEQKKPKPKPQKPKDEDDQEEDHEDEAKELLDQILDAVKKKGNFTNRTELDGLKQKASILKEYFMAKNEETKNRKLEMNLFEKDEVLRILGFAINIVRNTLVNQPNNFAVNLEGLNQKEIKDYVQEENNRILEDLQKVGNQFE